MKCLPSGMNSGNPLDRLAFFVRTSTHGPPLLDTRRIGPVSLPKRISPFVFHAPPRPRPVPRQSSFAGPPIADTVFSFPSAKNPIKRLSADQKGVRAFRAESIRFHSVPSRGRTHNPDWLSRVNIAATRDPSGETLT